MSTQTIQALPAEALALVQRIVVSEIEYSRVLNARHTDPTWRRNFSYDSREMIREQMSCLRDVEEFEDVVVDDCSENYDGRIYYHVSNESAQNILKQCAGKSLTELVAGVSFMTGSISFDLDELCTSLEEDLEIDVPRSWFEENAYYVDDEGALVLGTAG